MKTIKYILGITILAAVISLATTDAIAGHGHSSVSVGVGFGSHGSSWGFSYSQGRPWHHPGPYWRGPYHHYYSWDYYDYPLVVERPVVVAQPTPVVVQQTPVVIQQTTPVVYTPPVEIGVDGRVKGQAPAPAAAPAPAPAAASTTVVWIKNDNGSQTPVELRPQGTGYIGPSNEYYSALPTEDQLKAQYGLKSNVQTAAPAAKTESVVVFIDNGNGSKTPVTLQKDGTNYIGPAGEKYTTMPTEEQLKALYGANTVAGQSEVQVEITKADGRKATVVLKKEGNEYIGPKGEHYPTMPTEEQLKLIYGK